MHENTMARTQESKGFRVTLNRQIGGCYWDFGPWSLDMEVAELSSSALWNFLSLWGENEKPNTFL